MDLIHNSLIVCEILIEDICLEGVFCSRIQIPLFCIDFKQSYLILDSLERSS